MIKRKFSHILPSPWTHNSPTITHICYETLSSIKECYQSTWTRFINFTHIRLIKICFLTFLKTNSYSLLHSIWKTKYQHIYLLYFDMNVWRLSLRKSAQSIPPWPSNTPKYAGFFQSVACSGFEKLRIIATLSSLYSLTGPWLVEAEYALMVPCPFLECLAGSKLLIGINILGNMGWLFYCVLIHRSSIWKDLGCIKIYYLTI